MEKEQKKGRSVRGGAHPRGARARDRARVDFGGTRTHPSPTASAPTSVIGIDPGITGAIVVTNGLDLVSWPIPVIRNGKQTEIDFQELIVRLDEIEKAFGKLQAFLERAVPMAMGSKSAFSYGRGFQAILDALAVVEGAFTMVEPQVWTKEMHQGISQSLKPKARSLIAVRRLFPRLVGLLPVKPKSKVLLDGPVDALLIAGYGLRRVRPEVETDFW